MRDAARHYLQAHAVRGVRMLVAVSAAAVLAACGALSKSTDVGAGLDPNTLYAEAKDEAATGAYDHAGPLFEKLEGRAAGTPLASRPSSRRPGALQGRRQGDRAGHARPLHQAAPGQPGARLCAYLQGLVNFNDNLGLFGILTRQDLSERDQKAAKESFESFKELVEQFPESRYAPDARLRMTYIVNSLAAVRGARGALLLQPRRLRGGHQPRAAGAARLPAVPALEEALYIMVQRYDALGMTQLRDDAERVLQQELPARAST